MAGGEGRTDTLVVIDPVYDRGLISIPIRFLERTDLSAGAKLVLALLHRHAAGHSPTWPTPPELAAELGASEGDVRAWRRELSAAGLFSLRNETVNGERITRLALGWRREDVQP